VLRPPLEPKQYLSVRYSQRLADQGAVASVGSRGDSFDNALAEAVNGLYKAELISPRGPWRTADQVELATLEWVEWWNQRRLHRALDHIPPRRTPSQLLPSAPTVQGGRLTPTVQASIKPRAVQSARVRKAASILAQVPSVCQRANRL
jgi:putative transposase